MALRSIVFAVTFLALCAGSVFAQTQPTRPSVGAFDEIMHIDTPRHGSDVYEDFVIDGWAFDLRSTVDLVHVWAWPTAGGIPRFLGASRADISHVDAGDHGWRVAARYVPPGQYYVVAYALSRTTQSFSNLTWSLVTVEPCLWRGAVAMPGVTPSGDNYLLIDQCYHGDNAPAGGYGKK